MRRLDSRSLNARCSMAETFSFNAVFAKPLEFADFDKKKLRKGIGEIGSQVRKIARKLISKRTVSRSFENPGKVTGALQASVTAKTSKSGFSTIIAARDTAGLRKRSDGNYFYPYALYYGHVGPRRGTASAFTRRTQRLRRWLKLGTTSSYRPRSFTVEQSTRERF